MPASTTREAHIDTTPSTRSPATNGWPLPEQQPLDSGISPTTAAETAAATADALRSPAVRRSPSTEPLLDPDTHSVAAEEMAVDTHGEGDPTPREQTAEERRLYRSFCNDAEQMKEIGRREAGADRPQQQQQQRLRELDPSTEFRKCLAIARKVAGDNVTGLWRDFLTKYRTPLAKAASSSTRAAASTALDERQLAHGLLATGDEVLREVAEAAYREFQRTVGAGVARWRTDFYKRSAAIGLAVQCERYASLCEAAPGYRAATHVNNESVLLRALFRDMCPEIRAALPPGFDNEQLARSGYGRQFRRVMQARRNGERWRLLTDELGIGALLLLDTAGTGTYLQHTLPDPIFVAWVRLIPRVVLGVIEAGEMARRYHDAIERDPDTVLQLPRLNIERTDYASYTPTERFQAEGDELAIIRRPGAVGRPFG